MNSKKTASKTAVESTPQHSSPARAILDVSGLPSYFYGAGHARIARKLFHICLARHANPDGTSIYPSQDTLAEECAGISNYEANKLACWLEHKAPYQLARKLGEPHPVYGTNQYVLVMPPPEAIERAKQEPTAKNQTKREQTRRRTAKWRAKQKQAREGTGQQTSATVTQQDSVTSPMRDATIRPSVTQQFGVGDATFSIGDTTFSVGDGENQPFSASTACIRPPDIDRQTQPPIQPPANSEGRTEGVSALSNLKTSDKKMQSKAALFSDWASDIIFDGTERRACPTAEDTRNFQKKVSEYGITRALLAFYRFMARPKGVGNLNDPLQMFFREFNHHVKDADLFLSQIGTDSGYDTLVELVEGIHFEVYPYDQARKWGGKSVHSQPLLDRALALVASEMASGSGVLCTDPYKGEQKNA